MMSAFGTRWYMMGTTLSGHLHLHRIENIKKEVKDPFQGGTIEAGAPKQ